MTSFAAAVPGRGHGHVGDHAPHGGPIVLFAVDHRLAYVVAILTGTAVTAALIVLLFVFASFLALLPLLVAAVSIVRWAEVARLVRAEVLRHGHRKQAD